MPKTYVYEGENYTEQEVLEASSNLNMSVDDYVSQYNLEVVDDTVETEPEKKKKDTQNKEDATAVSTDGASSSEDTSSDSTKAAAPTGSYYDPELGRQVPIRPDAVKPEEVDLESISIQQPEESDQVNITIKPDKEDPKTNVDISDKDKEIITALRTGGNIKKDKLVEVGEEDFSVSLADEAAPGVITTRENEKELIEEFQKPKGQALLNVELETGADAVQSRRRQLYGTEEQKEIQTFETDEGSQVTFTTPGAEPFTVSAGGSFYDQLGIPNNVNIITGPDAGKLQDDFIKEDKQRIANESLAYIPLDERDDAVRLRQIKEDIKELKDPTSDRFKNIISESKPLEIGENLNTEMSKLLKEADKIVKNLQKDQDYAGGKLYDWNTGKFVNEDEANSTLISETNKGTNKYDGTSLEKLENLRYQTGLELIHLGTNAYNDQANIRNNSAETVLGEALTGSADPTATADAFTGGDLSAATRARKQRTGEYEQEAQEISDIGLDKQIVTEYKGDLDYDFNRLEELTRTRSIPKGLTLLPPSTLSAMRYNDKLKEFYYINRALELNEQRDFSVREPLLDIATKSIVGTITDDSYYNRREINSKLIDMQQEIVGGDPAFWNTLRSINGGGYYDIESGEVVTDTWWRDQFEDLAGGLGPLLQMSLEFFAGAGMFQAMKAGKLAEFLSKYGAKFWDDLFYGSKTYQTTNAWRTIAPSLNPSNYRAGRFFQDYFANAFNEFMVIEGYNLIKWTQNGFNDDAGDFLTGSGDDMISGNFVWGAAAMKTIFPAFAKYLKQRGSERINNLINLYNDNKVIGGLVKGTLEPAFAAATIMAGETGVAIKEGDLKKLEEIYTLENAFQLYGTMAIIRYATPESFDQLTKTMNELNNKFSTWRKTNDRAIRKAAEDFGVDIKDTGDRKGLLLNYDNINKIADQRLKKEGITKDEVLDIEYKRRLLQAANDVKYYENQNIKNQDTYKKNQQQINKFLDNAINNKLGQDYRDVEAALTWGQEMTQDRLFSNLDRKASYLSPQELMNLKTKIKEFTADALRFERSMLESGMDAGERASLWNLRTELHVLMAQKNQIEEDAKIKDATGKTIGVENNNYQQAKLSEVDNKIDQVNNKINNIVNKKDARIQAQNEQSKITAELLNKITGKDTFNFVTNKDFLNITGNELANGVKLAEDGKIYVNEDRINSTEGWVVRSGNMLKIKPKGGVLEHEIFHHIEQYPEFNNLTTQQKKDLVERFKQELTADEIRRVKNLSPGKLSDPTTTEWINYYMQAVVAGDIKPKSPRSELNLSDVDLNNAKQFKTWLDNLSKDLKDQAIKDYIKDAIYKAQVEFNKGKVTLTEDQYSEVMFPDFPEEYDATTSNEVDRLIKEQEDLKRLNIAEAKTADRQTLIDRSNRIKEINKKLDDPKYAIDAIFSRNKNNWDQVKNSEKIVKEVVDQYEDLLNTWADKAERVIKDKYPGARFNRSDYIEEMKGARGILDALDKFDISKQEKDGWSLNGWINYIVKSRQPEFINNSLDGYKVDIDKTGDGPSYTMDEQGLIETPASETESARKQLEGILPTFESGNNYFDIDGMDMLSGRKVPETVVDDIKKFLDKTDGPKIIFMGGLPGSGKSTAIDLLKEQIPELKNFEVFNVDYYIEKVKKEKGLPSSPPPKGTKEYQEYSQELGRIMADARRDMKAKRDAAISKGKNIIVDGTAASMGDRSDVSKTFNQAIESNKYKPIGTAIIDVRITEQQSKDAQRVRAEGGGRGLDLRVIEKTAESYRKSDADRKTQFNIDQSKRVITSGAQFLKKNPDINLTTDSKVRDEIYDDLLETGGNPYYSEILKDLGTREKYDETLKELKPFIDALDPRIYKKYGIDIYYKPVMTEGGGSQKKVDGVLQFREVKPTDKQYIDYWMGVGKTANTKGNRKQMLAKIIGAQMAIDGVMEAQRIAVKNNGIVPIYNNAGKQTGTIDIYEGLTPEQRIERGKEYYISELGNKLRRDPNQQFSEDSFEKATEMFMEIPDNKREQIVWLFQNASNIARTKDETGLTDKDLNDLIANIAKLTEVKTLEEVIGDEIIVEYKVTTDIGEGELNKRLQDRATIEKITDNEYIVRAGEDFKSIEKDLASIDKNFNKAVYRDAEGFKEIVDKFNEGLPKNKQIQAMPLPKNNIPTRSKEGDRSSFYYDILGLNGEAARVEAYNRKKRYDKNIASILNNLPKELLDKYGAEILRTLGYSKYKTALNDKGQLVRVGINDLGGTANRKAMSEWLGGEEIIGTDVSFDVPANIMSGSQSSGNIKKYHLGKVFGEFKVPNSKGKKNKKGEVILEKKIATSYNEAQEFKRKGYEQVTEGYVDTYDLKPGDKLPLEAKLDFKESFQNKFTKGTDNTFDQVVEANKNLLNTFTQGIVDEVIKREGDPDSQRELIEDFAYFMRLQTNVGDGVIKGAFTVTNITDRVPFEPTKESPTHAEHNLALSAYSNNLLRYTKEYIQGEINAEDYKNKVKILSELGTQSIILRDQQRLQDVDPTTGKSRKGTGVDLKGDVDVEVQGLESFDYMYDSIDLTGDPSKAVNVLEGSIKRALSNDAENLPTIEKINELESKLNKLELDKKGEDKLTNIKKKIIEDGLDDLEFNSKDLNKNINDLENLVDQYSEDSFEQDKSTFNAGMRQRFGDKWNTLPTEKQPATKEGLTKERKSIFPYSAMDYNTLLYQLYPKKGGQQFKNFIEDKIIDTYWDGISNIESDRVASSKNINALNKYAKDIGISPKGEAFKDSFEKGEISYTNDDAVRIYLWNKQGKDIPGISEETINKAIETVRNNPELTMYANEVDKISKGDYPEAGTAWIVGNVAGDIAMNTTNNRSKYLEEWNDNFNNLFTDEVLNKITAELGPEYVKNLLAVKERMLSGSNRQQQADYWSNKIMNVLNQQVGATMNFNTRSAFMQLLSAGNYINVSFNNPLRVLERLSRPDLMLKDFKNAWTSDYLVDRRGQGSRTIAEAEIQDALKSPNWYQKLLNLYLSAGYTPNKIMDSLAQAIGASTWIRNKAKYDILKRPGNENMSMDEAMKIAEKDWVDYSRTTQQSNDPALLSEMQVSLLGRSLLQYGNTQQQYVRKTYQDILDAVAGRTGNGGYKDLLYSILNYSVAQNVAYGFFFNALFTIMADENTPEEEKRKYISVINGVIDANLKGLGIIGALVGQSKNAAIELSKQIDNLLDKQAAIEAGESTAGMDQVKLDKFIKELIRIVPAISGRISMLENANYHIKKAGTKKYNENKDDVPFYNNPELNAIASLVEGTLSVPLEELLRKFEAWDYILNSQAETWQKVAAFLGYEPYQLTSKEKEEFEKTETKYNTQQKIKQFERATGGKKVKPDAMRGKVRPGVN